MSGTIRYIKYTNEEALGGVELFGKDAMDFATVVELPAIAVNANANVFKLKGAGKILEIISAQIWKGTSAVRAGDTQAQSPIITISADGKIINVANPNQGGAAIADTDLLKLSLVIGF